MFFLSFLCLVLLLGWCWVFLVSVSHTYTHANECSSEHFDRLNNKKKNKFNRYVGPGCSPLMPFLCLNFRSLDDFRMTDLKFQHFYENWFVSNQTVFTIGDKNHQTSEKCKRTNQQLHYFSVKFPS